ncbi:BTAD domain-containing putative transcriptional regulator [Actinoplanes sp. TBRC 11911]|uniref:AfsR/SARP family transcriptional regulator n=1 Tax=Actinoplanes sp. TBRC 11911 TaxID=2729386 RepID=UPI00289D4C49|nr:BTAD domain-containing putative transcriptional regulator [Actinoplanes sp. TBRC 11911]
MGGDGGSAARLRVTLLGTFAVCRGDTAVPLPGARLRGLLTRLALAGGRAVPPGVLIDALWPEEDLGSPVNALQSLVSRLRKLLGAADAVVQVEGGYRLDVTDDAVDALRFERLAADGRERLRTGDARSAAALLAEAVALWAAAGTSAATADTSAAMADTIAAVAPAVAARLARVATDAGADLAEAELALGDAAAAGTRLTALLAEQPADERVAALLMDALAAQGRQAEALDLYERVREELADRLGADPGAALRERHTRLLRAEPAPAEPAPSTGNLPASLTSFIGRDDDLARIDTLLAAGRLVTVVGPGGAGKTRIALEAGRRHRHEYRDGTWLIDLSAVTESSKVAGAVLADIGLRGSALFEGRMRVGDDELDVLADQLSGRESLLLVDNCEHLIDAVAYVVEALLRRCSGLRVLATSREPLAVDGESLVPLGSLALPSVDDGVVQARRTASVRLFTERAAAVRPGFDVDDRTLGDVLQVVRGLDGMPLALELAAARLRTLTLADLAAGLSDRFRLLTTGSRTALPRHRTLRAVIAWSWELLGPHERTVAERVSVLPGGVTPASATAVCGGTDVPAAEIADLLAALVDKSLLQLSPEPGRYRMLETLREYGIERLAERGELNAVRDLAAHHLARLVARRDPQLRGAGQLDALREMAAEYDNALAALRHLCDSGDGVGAITLGMNLSWYWQMFGRHQEATYWLGEVLALPGAERTPVRDSAEAVLLLNQIGSRSAAAVEAVQASEAQLRERAERLLTYSALPAFGSALAAVSLFFPREVERALVIIDRLIEGPDVWLSGLAHMFRAQVFENEGNLDQVRLDVDAALDCFTRAGDRWGVATALPMRALMRQYDGDLDGALGDLNEARANAREFGSLSLGDEIFIDMRWIDLHMRRGDEDQALAVLETARDRSLRASSPEMDVLVSAMEATVLLQVGELDRAEELLRRADAGMTSGVPFGGDHGRALVHAAWSWLSLKRGDPARAEDALAAAYAAAVETRDMPIMSMVAVAAAAVAQAHGRHRDVAFLLGAAARLRGTHDLSDLRIKEMLGRSRDALGEDASAEAYQTGWQLDSKAASAQIDPRLRPQLPSNRPAHHPEAD